MVNPNGGTVRQTSLNRISTERDELRMDVVHAFLARSYWARGIPREVVERSLQNSLCFGVYEHREQVGFARVVTDYATFGYLSDVFIVGSRRGLGLGKWLMDCVVAHPELQGFRKWLLATADAHGLYAQYGFSPLRRPETFMEIDRPDLYGHGGE